MHTFSPIPTALGAHPDWCQAHLGDAGALTCISPDQVISTTSPFSAVEHAEIYVSLEQPAGVDITAVRLSGASDTPMHPLQAIQVGTALLSAAFAALTGQGVPR